MDKEKNALLDEYYIYKLGRNAKERTLKSYINNIKAFFKYIPKPVDEITLDDINNYMIYLKIELKNSNNTQKLKQTAIRLFYAWYSKRYQKPNPTEWLAPIREEIKVPIMPTEDEFLRMVYACDVTTFIGRRNAALLCILADTGIRRSECSALNIGNIQLHENNYLCVVPKIKSYERMVPFGDLTQGALVGEFFTSYYSEIKYVLGWKPGEPLFKQMGIRYKDGRLGVQGINKLVQRYAKLAEIDRHFTAHSFRHFFGTYSYINGTGIREIQQLMGHAWLATTERYIHIAEVIKANSLKHRATTHLQAPKQWSGFVQNIKKTQRDLVKK